MTKDCRRRTVGFIVYALFLLGRFAYGFIVGYVLWWLLMRPYLQLLHVTYGHYIPELMFSISIALAFMFSTRAKVLMVLFLPTMVGSATQNYVIFLLFAIVVSNPIQSIATNAVESTRVIGCSLTMAFEHLEKRSRLLFNPLIEVFSDQNYTDFKAAKEDLLHLRNMISEMRREAEVKRDLDIVEDVKNKIPHSLPSDEILISDMNKIVPNDTRIGKEAIVKAKEILKETRLRLDRDNLALKASFDAEQLYKLMASNLTGPIEEFNLTSIMYENCLGIFRQAKLNCQLAIEDMRLACKKKIGSFLSALWCSPVSFGMSTLCPWVLSQVTNEKGACNKLLMSTRIGRDPLNMTGGPDINSVYRNLTDKVAKLGGDLLETGDLSSSVRLERPQRLEISIEFNNATKRALRTAESFWSFIRDKYEMRRLAYDIMVLLYEIYTTYTFLSIIYQAHIYRKRYLTDVKFDNYYITGQFIKLDRYWKDLGRGCVLPLSKSESKRYITTLTCKRRTTEERETQQASCQMTVLFLLFMLALFYFDHIFYSILSSIRKHALIIFRDKGHHRLHIEVLGAGSVAWLVRRLTKRLGSLRELDEETSTLDCLPIPSQTMSLFYIEFLGLVVVYVAIDQLSIYAMRLRRMTMACFHPTKESKRIEYLHRLILLQRERQRDFGVQDYLEEDRELSNTKPDDEGSLTVRDVFFYLGDCISASLSCSRSAHRSKSDDFLWQRDR